MNRRQRICMSALFLGTAVGWQGVGALEGNSAPAVTPEVASPEVARVNGTAILASQLEERVRLSLRKLTRSSTEPSTDQVQALRKQLLDDLVDEELLHQASLREKIQVPEKAVEDQARALEGNFTSGEEFALSLREGGMTSASVRERIRRNLAVEELVNRKVRAGVTVSETEIADYYAKNKDRLRRPEAAHALEIFARLDSRADPAAKGKLRQAMEAVLKEIKSGKDFASLVDEFSQGLSASRGGDLGWLTLGGSRPLLAEAALKLKPGEISDVLETPAGLHILKVLEKRPAEDVSLLEAKSQIESILRQQKEESALRDYVATLKTGAKVEIFAPIP